MVMVKIVVGVMVMVRVSPSCAAVKMGLTPVSNGSAVIAAFFELGRFNSIVNGFCWGTGVICRALSFLTRRKAPLVFR